MIQHTNKKKHYYCGNVLANGILTKLRPNSDSNHYLRLLEIVWNWKKKAFEWFSDFAYHNLISNGSWTVQLHRHDAPTVQLTL